MRSTHSILGVAAAALLALAACAPVPIVLDTPKDGDKVAVSVEQPMQVRLANRSRAAGAWVLEKGPSAALSAVGHKTEQPEGGAMALDVFDFVGARSGDDALTFVYRRKDGSPPAEEERVSISVAVP